MHTEEWVSLILLRTMREMRTGEWVFLVLLRTTREMRTGEWVFLILLRTTHGMCRCQNSHFTEWIHKDSWIHYTTCTTRTNGQVSFTSRYKSSVLDNPLARYHPRCFVTVSFCFLKRRHCFTSWCDWLRDGIEIWANISFCASSKTEPNHSYYWRPVSSVICQKFCINI